MQYRMNMDNVKVEVLDEVEYHEALLSTIIETEREEDTGMPQSNLNFGGELLHLNIDDI